MKVIKEHIGMRKLGIGLAIAGLTLSGGLMVSAQSPENAPGVTPGMDPHRPPMERTMGMHGDFGRWWNNPRVIDKFKLTDTQRKSMDDVYQQHRVTLVDLHATLEKAELAMEPMMREDQPDEGKILSQIDRVAQARAELEKANARMLLELRKQLTPDQWKQMEAERAARRERGPNADGANRWHGHGGAPGGAGGQPAGQPSGPPPGPGPNEAGPMGPGGDF